jgi:cytochrome c biogenesis factor
MTSISQIGELLIHWGQDVTLENVVQQRIWVGINFFVLFSALVAVVLIVAAGYGFMTSAGDPEKIKKAQQTLTAAIVGMIIVFMARMIVGFVLDVAQDNVSGGSGTGGSGYIPATREPY